MITVGIGDTRRITLLVRQQIAMLGLAMPNPASGSTQTINIGGGSVAGNTANDVTIGIGSGNGTSSVTIGSLTGASALTLRSGSVLLISRQALLLELSPLVLLHPLASSIEEPQQLPTQSMLAMLILLLAVLKLLTLAEVQLQAILLTMLQSALVAAMVLLR